MKHVVKNIHFVGIGGSGMSGIAEVLLNLGYCVSGSDLNRTAVTNRLAALGARIVLGHQAEHIGEANAVVVSSAIRADNPEVLAARQRGIPLVPRAAMLAELMRLKQGIAIAGTHGKTTTTSLVASILARGGFDPTFVIGGRLNSAGANARLGTGDFIVAEADESDASFLNLFPVIEVITNIDMDHMETYGHDFTKLKQAFIDFTQHLPFYGIAVLCVDDPHVCEILPAVTKPIVRYGLSEQAQVRAVEIRAEAGRMHFTVLRADAAPLAIELNLPGLHNVRNALAAIAIATELEVADEAICQALAEFTGVDRRFQRYGEISLSAGGSYTLVDDYGHHPVEMAATIAAARGAFVGRRLVLAFQPHRFTRTRDCFKDFVKVLSNADAVILTEVYSAGEEPITAADGQALVRALRALGKVDAVFAETIEAMPEAITQQARAGDVVITMGAGSMGHVPVWLTQSHI